MVTGRQHISAALLWLLFSGLITAQQLDTLQVRRLVRLQDTIDSLRQELRHINGELQQVKTEVAEGNDLDKLLAAFNSEDVESVPEDQRSRRKRVDALLKIFSEQPGVLRFNGDATAIFQGSDNRGRFSTAVGSFDIFAHTSFGKSTLIFFDLEGIGGNGPDELLNPLVTLNGDAGSTQDSRGLDQIHVLEAWAEFNFLKEYLTVTAGKIDLTNYFDNNASANDETSQFISGAFVNSAALAVPSNSPGIRVRTTVLERFFVQVGVSSLDNSGRQIFDDLFKIGSVGFRTFPNTGWEANVRLYGYKHPASSRAHGYGVSFDEAVAGAFTVFGRYNRNRADLANWLGIRSAWSGGLRFVHRLMGKRLAIGLAYGESDPAPQELHNEQIAEVYVRQHLNKWVLVSLHFQRAIHIGGLHRNVSLLGFRTHFNF